MMMRLGRMRRAFRTRSRCVTWPLSSILAGRVSRRTTWGCWSLSSAESSMVMILSPSGMKQERIFKSVVLPAPVPPEIRMLSRLLTAPCRNCIICRLIELLAMRSSMLRMSVRKRLIESIGPSSATGGIMALTREPSGSRASTMGDASSTRRPTAERMRSMMSMRCSSSLKRVSVNSSLPNFSMYICPEVLTRTSEMSGSCMNCSIGPRPSVSLWISEVSRSLLSLERARFSSSSRTSMASLICFRRSLWSSPERATRSSLSRSF